MSNPHRATRQTRGGAAPEQAAVYIRIGSRSAGFILPDELRSMRNTGGLILQGCDNALTVIMEYVEPVEAGGQDQGSMEMPM